MIRKDDRTDEQRGTHTVLIGGYDSFMSGWGEAKGGNSCACWACRPEHAKQVERWVSSRSDMRRVAKRPENWRPSNCKHLHIYVVGDNHPAIEGE